MATMVSQAKHGLASTTVLLDNSVAVSRRMTQIMLAVYVFTLPIQRSFQFAGLGSPSTVAAFVALLSAAWCLIGPLHHRIHRHLTLMAIFAAIVVLTLGATPLPTMTANPYLRGLGPDVAQQAIQLLLVTWMLWEFIERSAAALFAAAYVAGCYVSVFVAVREIGDTGVRSYRIALGVTSQLNIQALVMSLGIPLAWFAFVRLGQPVARLFMIAYLPAAVAGVLLTGSRSGTIACIAAFGCLLPSLRSMSVPARAFGLASALAAIPFMPGLLPEPAVERAVSTFVDDELTESATDVRLSLWSQGVAVSAANPWLGGGQGAVRQRVVETTNYSAENSSHNSFINIAADYGLLAAAAFVAIYLSQIRHVGALRGFDRWIAIALLVPMLISMQVINWEWEKVHWFVLAFVPIIADSSRRSAADSATRGDLLGTLAHRDSNDLRATR